MGLDCGEFLVRDSGKSDACGKVGLLGGDGAGWSGFGVWKNWSCDLFDGDLRISLMGCAIRSRFGVEGLWDSGGGGRGSEEGPGFGFGWSCIWGWVEDW